jgi:hypothetical protein
LLAIKITIRSAAGLLRHLSTGRLILILHLPVHQSMSSNYPHVRRLLKALADKMPSTNSIARTNEDGLLPYSVPSPSSLTSTPSRSAPPTAESIEANRCVELCLSGQETAMMMHGLRCMGSEWAQVRVKESSSNLTKFNELLPIPRRKRHALMH